MKDFSFPRKEKKPSQRLVMVIVKVGLRNITQRFTVDQSVKCFIKTRLLSFSEPGKYNICHIMLAIMLIWGQELFSSKRKTKAEITNEKSAFTLHRQFAEQFVSKCFNDLIIYLQQETIQLLYNLVNIVESSCVATGPLDTIIGPKNM